MKIERIITRKDICHRIDEVLGNKLSAREFGEEVFDFLAFVGEKYKFEGGYEELLEESLREFMDLHDVGKEGLSYMPHIPSREEMIRIKNKLCE